MSSAAVSQQIQSLEGYLDRPLFQRTANRVQLSSAGTDFLPTVQVSLNAIETKAMMLFGSERTERVVIRASQLMAMSWLPRVLSEFEVANPLIRVTLQMGDTPRAISPDLEIRFRDETDPLPAANRLMTMTHVAFGRRQDIDRVRDLDGVLSFRLFDVATHATGWTQLLENAFGPLEHRRPMIESVDTTPLALLMVSQGLGLGIGHMPVCMPLARTLGLEILPLLPEIRSSGSYFLEFAEDRRSRPAVQKLGSALQQAASSAE